MASWKAKKESQELKKVILKQYKDTWSQNKKEKRLYKGRWVLNFVLKKKVAAVAVATTLETCDRSPVETIHLSIFVLLGQLYPKPFIRIVYWGEGLVSFQPKWSTKTVQVRLKGFNMSFS